MAGDESISVTFDLDDLTFGEMVDFEEVSGIPITDIKQGSSFSSKALLALVWISGRRKDPTFTIEQARETRVDDVNYLDPTTPEQTGEPQALKPRAQKKAS